eukprot:4635476-Amphidinium_carterae.1
MQASRVEHTLRKSITEVARTMLFKHPVLGTQVGAGLKMEHFLAAVHFLEDPESCVLMSHEERLANAAGYQTIVAASVHGDNGGKADKAFAGLIVACCSRHRSSNRSNS